MTRQRAEGIASSAAARSRIAPAWRWVAERSDYAAVIVAYTMLTVLFTWPLVLNFGSYVNGDVMDIFHELWYLHLDYTAPYGPFFLLHISTILYPFGVPTYFQVLSPLHAIIGAPIYYFFGLVPAYNFLYMFTFVGAAFTAYLLVLYLTKNKYAAFFAGIAFGFAPVHAAQGLSHLNIMAAELLPLFALFLVKLAREPRERNAIYAGVVLALNAMLDLHFLLLCLIMITAFLIYYLVFVRREVLNKPFILRFAIMIAVAGCLGFIVYFQTFYGLISASGQGAGAAATVSAHARTSADLLQFFFPPPQNPILGQYTAAIYQNFSSATEIQTYFGYTVLVLAVVGLAVNRKRRDLYFWGFLAVLGLLMALGPTVQLNGHNTKIPGLWSLLYAVVPLFNSFRTPFRIDYEVALGLAVLSGYGVAVVMSRLDRVRLRRWRRLTPAVTKAAVLTLFCILLVFEFLPIPYPMMNAQPPPAYSQILANDHSDYAVMEVPAYLSNDVYLYYQSVYNHPTVNGHVSRTPPASLIFIQGAPFVDLLGQFLQTNLKPSTDILNQTIDTQKLAPFILSQYGIKYVIVHKDLLPASLYKSAIGNLSGSVGMPIYNDSLTTVYRVATAPSTGLYQYLQASNSSYVEVLSGGWNPIGLTGANARSMGASAGIQVYSRTTQYMQLRLHMEGISGNYHIQVQVNGVDHGTYLVVNGTYATYTTPYVQLQQGFNQITFTSSEGCSSANKGAACASAQFSDIDLVVARTA